MMLGTLADASCSLGEKCRCVVLAGGPSAERDVSLRTGDAIEASLKKQGATVRRFDPADGTLVGLEPVEQEVVVLALHGTYGEDGTVQRELSERRIAFTGDNEAASELAFDKWESRQAVAQAGGVVSAGVLASLRVDWDTYPCIVKPRREGSSVGLYLCHDAEEVAAAVKALERPEDEILIEAFIDGEEFTVGLVNRQLLPPVRVRPPREVFDAHAKYEDEATRFEPLTNTSDSRFKVLHDAASSAFAAVGVEKLGRADFILRADGTAVFLEVNTLPGMTERSLLPLAWEAAGGTFDTLVAAIVSAAVP